jgi:hypothetical protein
MWTKPGKALQSGQARYGSHRTSNATMAAKGSSIAAVPANAAAMAAVMAAGMFQLWQH